MSAVEYTEQDLAAREEALLAAEPTVIGCQIAARYGITYALLLSQFRWKPLPQARAEFYRALRALGWSYPTIGRFVGSRDHTTIIAALRGPEAKAARAAKAKSRWATRPERSGAT